MYIFEFRFERYLKSIIQVAYVFVLVFVWQATHPTLLGQFGSSVQQFPQVVINGGSTTSFSIHNPSNTTTISVDVQLYTPEGNLLANRQVELTPGATESVLFGDAQAPLTRGWAELQSDDEFIATEFFQLFLGGLKPRVGVLPSPPSEEIRFMAFVNDQFKSGLAVHNPSPTEATQFTVRVKDQAAQQPVSEKTLRLDPLHSVALFLDDPLLFGVSLKNFEGVVEVSVNSPPVAVLSLIQEAGGDVATVAVETPSFLITDPTNTAIGRNTLLANTTGLSNTASGADALGSNTSGKSNTASGRSALRSNTTGPFNTATGASALFSNTTGSNNIATGVNALRSNTTGARNVASGVDTLASNTTGDYNAAHGHNALVDNITGSRNTATGCIALLTNTTGVLNSALGYGADVASGDLTNATAIGANAKVDASNKIRLGDNNVSVIEAPVGLTVVSDKTKKENFQSVDGEEVLGKLRSLEVPSWNFIGQDPETFRHYGPMAQDFFAAFGKDGLGTIGTPTTINTSDLVGILMIAVQSLEIRTAENAELRTRVEELEQAIEHFH